MSATHARYEIFKDAAGKFRWRLVASSGEVMAVSEACESKERCLDIIRAVQAIAMKAGIFDLAAPDASELSRLERARKLMQQRRPERFVLKVGQKLAMSQDLMVTKKPDGRIILYEIVGE